MIEYIYHGFKISYEIESVKHDENHYKANGHAMYLLNSPASLSSANFHAEYATHASTEHEIRTLLENYVDFELKTYYAQKAAAVV